MHKSRQVCLEQLCRLSPEQGLPRKLPSPTGVPGGRAASAPSSSAALASLLPPVVRGGALGHPLLGAPARTPAWAGQACSLGLREARWRAFLSAWPGRVAGTQQVQLSAQRCMLLSAQQAGGAGARQHPLRYLRI